MRLETFGRDTLSTSLDGASCVFDQCRLSRIIQTDPLLIRFPKFLVGQRFVFPLFFIVDEIAQLIDHWRDLVDCD